MPNGDIVMSEEEHVTSGKGMSMPWTNMISDCSRAFKEAVLADPVFHDVHKELPISVYCIDVVPEMPWIVAVFDGLTDLTKPAEFKQALLSKFLADPVVTQMVDNDHSSVPGDHQHDFVFKVILHFAEVGTYTVRRRTLTIWKRA
ncbi:hypothetical protein B0H14DRAFT_2592625 [Mycena olivaceomarginata]|nr:hypothetical protein B0H14DRAFT_2592625 [Mycena olivaceomarginata]